MLGCLSALWVISGITFISTMKSGYARNFLSFMTARQMVKNLFLDNEDPKVKIAVFEYNPSYINTIYSDVSQWVVENYEIWKNQGKE